MNYKLFLPTGSKEFGSNVILENGLSFPRYVFVAVPIVGLKSNLSKDLLSDVETKEIYYDTKSNRFTFNKKVRNIQIPPKLSDDPSLTDASKNGIIKFNFDGYINVSKLISNIKKQINDIKEKEANLIAFEQDVGYTSVRNTNLLPYEIVTINPNDDFESFSYQLSDSLTLGDLLIYDLKTQTLLPQNGVSKKIIVKNLKNLAVNVYENVKNNLTNSVEIVTAYTEKVYYASDEEFYIGEAIQFRFPGLNSNSVYLIAKDMLNSLAFNKLYLDYYLDKEPTITVILNPEGQGLDFGTRFENYLVHPGKLVNIDKNFDDILENSLELPNAVVANLSINSDKRVIERFIRDAIDAGYVQSEEDAIKFAFQTDLNISDLVVTPVQNANTVNEKFFEPIDYESDYSYSGNDEEFSRAVRQLLPSLIKCPQISNGSVRGKPKDSIFPMLSNVAFKPLTDLTMLYNPSKTSGQNSIPQNIRFNNPLAVPVIKGVTDKLEDGFIGELEGLAVYANRMGGLIAGIRRMQNSNLNGKTLQNAAKAFLGAGQIVKLFAKLSDAIFDVIDPTGSMLGCSQLDLDNGNINDLAVMVGMMIATISNEKRSSVSYDEIVIALQHAKGNKDQFNKTIDGNDINKTRDASKEVPAGTTKIDQDPASTPLQIANSVINGVKTLIETGLGKDIVNKSERKENQKDTFTPYDSSGDHRDRYDNVGSYIISSIQSTKDEIFK